MSHYRSIFKKSRHLELESVSYLVHVMNLPRAGNMLQLSVDLSQHSGSRLELRIPASNIPHHLKKKSLQSLITE
jgi:hypothetical protein